jgi:hypothetical protein
MSGRNINKEIKRNDKKKKWAFSKGEKERWL